MSSVDDEEDQELNNNNEDEFKNLLYFYLIMIFWTHSALTALPEHIRIKCTDNPWLTACFWFPFGMVAVIMGWIELIFSLLRILFKN